MFPSIVSFIIADLDPRALYLCPFYVANSTIQTSIYKAASIPKTATPRPTIGPAVWRAAPAVLATTALPEAEAVAAALPEGVLVPEMAVTEAEEADEADPDAAAEAEEEAEAEAEAEALELPQSGVVSRVTPAPVQRV